MVKYKINNVGQILSISNRQFFVSIVVRFVIMKNYMLKEKKMWL